MKMSHCRGQNIKVFDIGKYDGLQMSDEFKNLASTEEGRAKIVKCCNGVGSDTGWFNSMIYHIIPNTIWFLNITACSDLHDTDYTYPTHFKNRAEALAYKAGADMRLYVNICIYVKAHTSNSILLDIRLRRADGYYWAVSHCGEESFLSGKTFDDDSMSTSSKLFLDTVVK